VGEIVCVCVCVCLCFRRRSASKSVLSPPHFNKDVSEEEWQERKKRKEKNAKHEKEEAMRSSTERRRMRARNLVLFKVHSLDFFLQQLACSPPLFMPLSFPLYVLLNCPSKRSFLG